MANSEQVEIIKQGPKTWNTWVKEHADVMVDLSGADLRNLQLRGVHLQDANLRGIVLEGTDLSFSKIVDPAVIPEELKSHYARGGELFVLSTFNSSNLEGANLRYANLYHADFTNADLSKASLQGAMLGEAILINAKLREADIRITDFSRAILDGADLTGAVMAGTVFGRNDLSNVIGLGNILHRAPSTVGVDTLYLSGATIPAEFLLGSGIPDMFLSHMPSLIGVQQAVEFYSCFISYSTKDDEFARRLYSRMRDEHLRVWFAPEDMKGGRKLHEQIERAIQIHDRLLLVLSENSMHSEWVMTEIRNARKAEVEESRRKLFPIRLVDLETVQHWKCFDSDRGRDLAVEIREYFIPDFSNWKDHDAFESAFEKLLRDLRPE